MGTQKGDETEEIGGVRLVPETCGQFQQIDIAKVQISLDISSIEERYQ